MKLQTSAKITEVPQASKQGIPAAADPLSTARPVRLIAGADVQDFALAGRTVGDARRIAQSLFTVRPEAQALIDGQEATDDQILGSSQTLEFVKFSGQKGIGALRRSKVPAVATGGSIQFEGDRATWKRDDEIVATLPIADLLDRVSRVGSAPTSWRLTPRSVVLQVERGPLTGVVLEMEPGPRQVQWIREDSEAPFGDDARYDLRRLSFPFVVLFVVFSDGQLTNVQQAYYRNQPIRSPDDPLFFTNLLNVADGYGLDSWVCLVNMHRRALRRLSWAERVQAVTDHFWHAAFTKSSEVHEGNSHWGTHKTSDPRLASPDAWENATQADPYFTLGVTWRTAPLTVRATLEKMLDMAAPWQPIARVEQLATLMQKES